MPLLSTRRGGGAEICWLVLEAGLWLDQRHQSFMSTGKTAISLGGRTEGASKDPVQFIEDALLLVAVGARLTMEVHSAALLRGEEDGAVRPCCEQPCDERCDAYESSRNMYVLYMVVISLKVIFAGLKTFTFLGDYEPLGVLIIMINEMVQDIVLFSALLVGVTVSFSSALAAQQYAGLYDSGEPDDPLRSVDGSAFTTHGAFWVPLWSTFGYYDLDNYSVIPAIFTWFFSFFCCIVLVNLLVAMFGETFNRVKTQAAVEFICLDTQRMFRFRDVVLSTPPVLNVPIILWDLFHRLSRRCASAKRRGPGAGHNNTNNNVEESFAEESLARSATTRLDTRRRRSSGPASLSTVRKKRPESNPYDGKLQAEAYVKQQMQLVDDAPQDIAQSILSGFEATHAAQEAASFARSEELNLIKGMISALNQDVQLIKGVLAAPQGRLAAGVATPAGAAIDGLIGGPPRSG